LLVGMVAVLALWLRPWTAGPPKPTIVGGRFHPEWTRIAPGDCAVYDDRRFCPVGTGAHRIKLAGKPYSGGFVLVDPEA
jgi:hypothetical protein